VLLPAEEEALQEEPLQGILLVEEELNDLIHNKFIKV
jgi:hypothetical protein